MTKWMSMLMILLGAQFAFAEVIELEAEDAKVDAANILEVKEASGGKVVAFDKKTKQSSVEFTFKVPADGEYQFWAVGRGMSGREDSFYTQLDKEKRETWDVKWNTSQDLIKQPVRYRVSKDDGKYFGKAYTAKLTKGEHTFVVSRREAGAQLDKLIIAPADMKIKEDKK